MRQITPTPGHSCAGSAVIRGALLTLLALAGLAAAPAAEPLRAEAAVDNARVFVGESFLLEIRVQGTNRPQTPDLSALAPDFAVQDAGTRDTSSSSVTILNGRVYRQEQVGCVVRYELTPKRAGALRIPPLTITSAGGQTAQTGAITIYATQPTEQEDYKLRLTLSTDRAYVGQPVTLTVTWYLNKNVRGFQFRVPALAEEAWQVVDPKTDPAKDAENAVEAPVNNERMVAHQGQGTLDGQAYTTVQFQKVLIPRRPGRFPLAAATVVFNAVTGYRRSHDPFATPFFGGSGREAVTRRVVIPSNEPVLTVLDLPAEGRPAAFTGLVGAYSLAASATPTDVRVGDPITLTIRVTGPDYLENVGLPALDAQEALARDFKVPHEMAPGKIEGPVIAFTQTVRARSDTVTAIPPIELPYFDAATGTYAVARSQPIPITVSSARVVTAADAEGNALPGSAAAALQTWTAGIAYNYEDLSVLENLAYGPHTWIRSPAWIALLAGLPLAYAFLALAATLHRRRSADPASARARRAERAFLARLGEVAHRDPHASPGLHDAVLQALRQYLGDKLRLPAGALTYRDVTGVLAARGVTAETRARLEGLFSAYEAQRYAGLPPAGTDSSRLLEEARAVVRELEGRL